MKKVTRKDYLSPVKTQSGGMSIKVRNNESAANQLALPSGDAE